MLAIEMLVWVGALLLALYVLVYATVVIRLIIRTHATNVTPAVRKRIDTAAEHLSPEMGQFIATTIAQLQRYGFAVIANECLPDVIPGTRNIQVILTQPSEKHAASLLIGYSKLGRAMTLVISSTFADGRRFGTSNGKAPGLLPKDPNVDAMNFPWVRDARILYEAHRRRLSACKQDLLPRIAPDENNVQKWLDQRWEEGVANAACYGYRYRDSDAGVYRCTWKGATLITLRSLPFVSRLRTRIAKKRARRVWDGLKMDSFELDAMPATSAIEPDDIAARERVGYQFKFTPGEIGRERRDGTTIIRIGGLSFGQLLIRNAIQLVVLAAFLVLFLLLLGCYFLLSRGTPVAVVFSSTFLWLPIIFLVVIVAPASFRVAHRLHDRGRTIVLSANADGLSFLNVPGNRHGDIPRDDIKAIRVVSARLLGEATGRLVVLRFGHRPQLLLRGWDVHTLNQIRQDLADAMGIDVPAIPPPLAMPGDERSPLGRG